MHLVDAFIQSDLQCIQAIHFQYHANMMQMSLCISLCSNKKKGFYDIKIFDTIEFS